jgi:hypothetical protein
MTSVTGMDQYVPWGLCAQHRQSRVAHRGFFEREGQ